MKLVIVGLLLGTASGELGNWRADLGFQFKADHCFTVMLNGVDFFNRGPIKLIYSTEAFLLKNGMRKGDRCDEFRYLAKRIVDRAARQPTLAMNLKSVRSLVDEALQTCVGCPPVFANASRNPDEANRDTTATTPSMGVVPLPSSGFQPQPMPTLLPGSITTTVIRPVPAATATNSTVVLPSRTSLTTTSSTTRLPPTGTAFTISPSTTQPAPITVAATSSSLVTPNSSVPTAGTTTEPAVALDDATETISTDTATARMTRLV
ncbi:hypothetical protein BIW11_13948 [Tropilaelaps mercedesae]|uniref:Uncharacterized protein n=1 Tax=Tropilaelaps mercedesae TaxID=418985 RepID=A0A1V9WZR6_9ACAR|nr:hypothetical protein BIW11_13948 [Tropilaelaps mercedesae]